MSAAAFLIEAIYALSLTPSSQVRSSDAPPEKLIIAIEKAIESSPCVERLDRWDRHYLYDPRPAQVDRTLVMFALVEAAGKGARHTAARNDVFDPPDEPFRFTGGVYDTKSGTATIEQCNELVDPPIG
ncbi:hypothetical protein [Sphingomonas koreensis]